MEDIREEERTDHEGSNRRRRKAYTKEGRRKEAGYTGVHNTGYIRADGLCTDSSVDGSDSKNGETF